MSKPKKRLRALPFLLLLLAAAVLLTARTQAEKQKYIDTRPDTPLMASLRAQSPNHSLDLDELVASPLPAEQDAGPILYNATFYPDARTVVCTVSVPGGGETAPYLVRYDRRPIPGRARPRRGPLRGAQALFRGGLRAPVRMARPCGRRLAERDGV